MEPTGLNEAAETGPKMTLRVYTVTPSGAVTSDTGMQGYEGADYVPVDLGQDYPPCRCPRCVRRVATR